MVKLFPVEEQEAVLRGQNRRHRRAGRRIGDERFHRLTSVRHEGRDINERRHFGIVARLGDHRPAVGMAYEDYRFALRVDDHPGRGDVAFERKCRILDDPGAVVVLEAVVDSPPAGTVHETAVNENDARGDHIRGVFRAHEALLTARREAFLSSMRRQVAISPPCAASLCHATPVSYDRNKVLYTLILSRLFARNFLERRTDEIRRTPQSEISRNDFPRWSVKAATGRSASEVRGLRSAASRA